MDHPGDLVELYAEDGRALGVVPLAQARALAAAAATGLQAEEGGVRLGGLPSGDDLPRRILTCFPMPIAASYRALLRETHAYTRVHRLVDAFEVTAEFVAIVMLQDALRAHGTSTRLGRALLARFPRPLTSAWLELFAVARDEIAAPFAPGLAAAPLERLGQPLLELRNRLAHGTVPEDEDCVARFVAGIDALHRLLGASASLADHALVEIGEGRLRRLVGPTPGPWESAEVPPGLPAGHLALRGEGWLDLHPLLLADGEAIESLLPLLLYAGLRESRVEFVTTARGRRSARADLYPLVVNRFVPGWRPGRRRTDGSPGLDALFSRYGKYEVLDLVGRGALRLDMLLAALRDDPSLAGDVLDAAIVGVERLREEVQDLGTSVVARALWFTPETAALAPRPLPLAPPELPVPLPPSDGVRPPDIVGRERLVVEVLSLLEREGVVTLHGVGGIGKTAVARAVLVCAATRGSVYEVSLIGIRDARDAAERIARAVGAPPPPADGAARALATHIGGRAVTVLLDNAEDLLAADPARARALIVGLGMHLLGPRLLLTSRAVLGDPSEHTVDIPALDAEAAQTLYDRRSGGAPTTSAVDAAGGHPLTIELLAAGRGVFGEGARDVLATSLGRSWEATTPGGQRLLAAIAFLPAGVSLQLAAAVIPEAGDRASALAHGLGRFEAGRFSAHEVVRQDVASRVSARGVFASVCRPVEGEVRELARRFDEGEPGQALEAFRVDEPNFGWVLRLLGASEAATWLEVASGLYTWAGMGARGLRHIDALDLSGLDAAQAARMARVEATWAYFVGRHDRAIRAAQRAISAPDVGDVHRARYILSAASRALGDLDTAEAEMNLSYLGSGEGTSSRANCLKELAVIADESGRPSEACHRFQEADAAYAAIERPIARAFAVQCHGVAERHRGNPVLAVSLARAALSEGRTHGEPRVQGYAWLDLAHLALDRGDRGSARRHLDDAEGCLRAADHVGKLMDVELGRVRLARQQGAWESAWERLTRLPAEDSGVILARAGLLLAVGRQRLARDLLLGFTAPSPRLRLQTASLGAWAGLGTWAAVASAATAIEDRRSQGRARLHSADREHLLALLGETTDDPRLEGRVALLLAAAGGEGSDAWAAHGSRILRECGSAVEQMEAAEIDAAGVRRGRDAGLREAAAAWLRAGHALRAVGVLKGLSRASAAERELVAFFSAGDVRELSGPWSRIDLRAAMGRRRLLLAVRPPLPALLDRALQESPPDPGADDVESLADAHILDLLARGR